MRTVCQLAKRTPPLLSEAIRVGLRKILCLKFEMQHFQSFIIIGLRSAQFGILAIRNVVRRSVWGQS